MDLLNSELGSSDKTRVTSTLDGNEEIGSEAGRVSDISEVVDQEKTIPATKTEPTLQVASALLSCKRKEVVYSDPSLLDSTPTSINYLPNEILLQILSHFGPEELCLIAKVCKRWKDLAKDAVLWKTHSYTCDNFSDISLFSEVLRVAPALHSLIVRRRDDAARILDFLFHIHVDLRKLILEYCYLGEDATGLFASIVSLYPDLEGLSLEDCHPLTSSVYRFFSSLKKLSELNLSDCEGLSGEIVRPIADSCQHLKKLSLDDGGLIDDDVIHIIKKLGKQLTMLVLDGESLTDVAYLYLNNCTRLQKLGVSFCKHMTDRGLLQGIGALQELTSLRLEYGFGLTAEALSVFLHQPSMSSIGLLDLSYCTNLDDEGLKGIAKSCIRLKGLRVRCCNKVTDAGISMVISRCNQLLVLDLKGVMSITGEGWLALVPSHLPRLRVLWLVGCRDVCDKYVEELVAAVPQLEVIR